MPNPKPNESRNDFIERCVIQLVENENRSQNQAIAICYSLYENKDNLPEVYCKICDSKMEHTVSCPCCSKITILKK